MHRSHTHKVTRLLRQLPHHCLGSQDLHRHQDCEEQPLLHRQVASSSEQTLLQDKLAKCQPQARAYLRILSSSVCSLLLSVQNKHATLKAAYFGELDLGFLPFFPGISYFGSIHSFTDQFSSKRVCQKGMWRNVLGTETASISYFSIFGEKELLMLKKRLRGMGNAESLGRLCTRRFCTGKMMTILYGTPSPHLLRKQNPSFHTTGIPMPFILRKAEPPSVSSPSG